MLEIISKNLPDNLELTITGRSSNFLFLEDYLKEFPEKNKVTIIAHPGAELTIIEKSCGFKEIEILLHQNSRVTHYCLITSVERRSSQNFTVKQLYQSNYTQHYFNFTCYELSRMLTVYLAEENASCKLTGVYVSCDSQKINNKIDVRHLAKNCFSEQDYKGVLFDKSNITLDSRVYVDLNASQTNAKQNSKHLMISNNANINVSPSLEIFHDDVICAHGATIGELDLNMIFYLQSRGFSYESALALIIKGFVSGNLAYVSDPALKTEIESSIENTWFKQSLESEI